MESSFLYEQWEQILNMLHDFRKDIDYITFTNTTSYRIKQNIWKNLKNITLHYLNYKYSCNPLLSRDSKEKAKKKLLEYLEENPDFGYTRNREVMRYVPYTERRRRPTISPPPPPSTQPIPPPPIPPPEIIIQQRNPFTPSNQLPRTPSNQLSRTPSNVQNRGRNMAGTLSLFRR